MTYLFKETTHENRLADAIALITGQAADDNGVTLSADDAWVNVGDGNGYTYLRAPNDTYLMTQEHRSGYLARIDDTFDSRIIPARTGSYSANNSPERDNYDLDGNRLRGETWCRQTQCWTNMNTDHYWWFAVHVYEPNTVAFDYSDAKIQTSLYYQSNYRQANTSSATYTTIATDGTIDYTYSSYNMKVQLGDPSGFLDPGARFVRLYDQNFLGGFDVHRFTENTVDPRTFNVTIDGVEGTDWAWTGGFGGYSADDDARPAYDERYDFSILYPASISSPWSYGKFSGGIGIKTNAALTGNRYEVVLPVEDSLIGFTQGTTTFIYTYAIPVENKGFTGVSNYWNGGVSVPTDLRGLTCKNATSTPPGTTPVRLYMNVTPDYINVICLLTGTAYGSQPGVLNHCRLLSPIDTNERSVWSTNNCYSMNDNQYPYPHTVTGPVPMWMKTFQDGATKGTRDWQTKWGMNDFRQTGIDASYSSRVETQYHTTYDATVQAMHYYREEDTSAIPGLESDADYATKSNVSTLGQGELPLVKLDLSSYYFTFSNDTSNNAVYTQNYGIQMGAMYPIPKNSLANGDEFEDVISGKKWKVFRTLSNNSVPKSSYYALMIEMN
jgi:hypothetical protein